MGILTHIYFPVTHQIFQEIKEVQRVHHKTREGGGNVNATKVNVDFGIQEGILNK